MRRGATYGPPPSDDESDLDDVWDDGHEGFRNPKQIPIKSNEEKVQELLVAHLTAGSLSEFRKVYEENQWIRINEPIINGAWTALMIASHYGWPALVTHLLEDCSAETNVFVAGTTALFVACSKERRDNDHEDVVLKVVQLLMGAKANVNRPNSSNGETPFMIAIRNGYERVVDWMLQSKTPLLEVWDREQNTAIMHAVDAERFNIVKMLIEVGANIDVSNREGYSPCQLAIEKNFLDIRGLFPEYNQRQVPTEYTSVHSYQDIIPTAFPERKIPPYVQDIFPMLTGMRIDNQAIKFVDGNVGLAEFLNVSDSRLKEIGITYPFQRKRVLFGLLKFHEHKFKKSLIPLPNVSTKPLAVNKYFDAIARCLKYLVVLKASLDFVEREELFDQSVELTDDSKTYLDGIEEFLQIIEGETNSLIRQFKPLETNLTPRPPLNITEDSLQLITKNSYFSKMNFMKCAALAAAAAGIHYLSK